MSCGLDPESCICEHWMPILGGRREPSGWRAPCPVCGNGRVLSVQVTGRRAAWKNHCPCDRDDVRLKLAALLPGCVASRYTPRRSVDRGDLIGIITDRTIPDGNALRVALLQALGVPAPQIKKSLGLSKQRWSEVVRNSGRNRRSAESGIPD